VTTYSSAYVIQEVQEVLPDSSAKIVETTTWLSTPWNSNDTASASPIKETRQVVLHVTQTGQIIDIAYDTAFGEIDVPEQHHIRTYYEQGIPIFPDHQLAPGNSWSQTTKVVLADHIVRANMSYRVTALVREGGYDCAVIEFTGNMTLPVESDTLSADRRTGVDRIESVGRLFFAYSEGLVVSQHERWIIDRERTGQIDGRQQHFREAIELDIDFVLQEHTIAAR
jgi:hypothetical protein